MSILSLELLLLTPNRYLIARGVYFNLLATQVFRWAPGIIDICMVELPTVFYFASFIIFLAIWWIKVSLMGRASRLLSTRRRFYLTLILVNSVFFILYLGLVLFFAFLPPDDHWV